MNIRDDFTVTQEQADTLNARIAQERETMNTAYENRFIVKHSDRDETTHSAHATKEAAVQTAHHEANNSGEKMYVSYLSNQGTTCLPVLPDTPSQERLKERMELHHRRARDFMFMARNPNSRTDIQYCVAMYITHSRAYAQALREYRDSGHYIDTTAYYWGPFIDKYGMEAVYETT